MTHVAFDAPGLSQIFFKKDKKRALNNEMNGVFMEALLAIITEINVKWMKTISNCNKFAHISHCVAFFRVWFGSTIKNNSNRKESNDWRNDSYYFHHVDAHNKKDLPKADSKASWVSPLPIVRDFWGFFSDVTYIWNVFPRQGSNFFYIMVKMRIIQFSLDRQIIWATKCHSSSITSRKKLS